MTLNHGVCERDKERLMLQRVRVNEGEKEQHVRGEGVTKRVRKKRATLEREGEEREIKERARE